MKKALFVTLLCPALALAEGSVTLPLDEVLRLQRESDARNRPPDPLPPLKASVARIELDGRLLDEGVELTAHLEVTTVADGVWMTIPLLTRDADLHLASLPSLVDAMLVVHDGQLALVTNHRGSWTFDVALRKHAEVTGTKRRAVLTCAPAALQVLRLKVDEALFRPTIPDALPAPDGLTVFPTNDRYVLAWEGRGPTAPAPRVERPPVESSVPRAFGSLVTTLEGRRLLRMLWELRLEGRQKIRVTVPAGQTLERVYVNGAATRFAQNSGEITIDVAPLRGGDETGTLELLLAQEREGFALSGRIDVSLPAVDWTVSDLYVDVHLPAVFTYAWLGGSLAPHENVPKREFTSDLPLPGTALEFRQQLLAGSSANVTVGYAVDLSAAYYK